MSLALRSAGASEVGPVREGNEDSAYAGTRLALIADGVGGMIAGEVASSVTLRSMRELDGEPVPDVVRALGAAVTAANTRVREAVAADPGLEGMGTTLTALLWNGSELGLAHIGDSRAYLLRDGRLEQVSVDHTFVQTLVDEGRITRAEVRTHPHRSLILQALDGRARIAPDLNRLELLAGDRFLLCSDGLSDVLVEDSIAQLLGEPDRSRAVRGLVDAALSAGATDNVTCLVVDAVEDGDDDGAGGAPAGDATGSAAAGSGATAAAVAGATFAGAAVADGAGAGGNGAGGTGTVGTGTGTDGTGIGAGGIGAGGAGAALVLGAAANPDVQRLLDRLEAATGSADGSRAGGPTGAARAGGGTTGAARASGPGDEADPEHVRYAPRPPRRFRWLGRTVAVLVVLAALAVGGRYAYRWTQTQYYVTASDGVVAIYQGIPYSVPGLTLSHQLSRAGDLPVASLPEYFRARVSDGNTVPASDLTQARAIVANLAGLAARCPAVAAPTATARPTTARPTTARPTTPPTATATARAGATTAPPRPTTSAPTAPRPTTPAPTTAAPTTPAPTPSTTVDAAACAGSLDLSAPGAAPTTAPPASPTAPTAPRTPPSTAATAPGRPATGPTTARGPATLAAPALTATATAGGPTSEAGGNPSAGDTADAGSPAAPDGTRPPGSGSPADRSPGAPSPTTASSRGPRTAATRPLRPVPTYPPTDGPAAATGPARTAAPDAADPEVPAPDATAPDPTAPGATARDAPAGGAR